MHRAKSWCPGQTRPLLQRELELELWSPRRKGHELNRRDANMKRLTDSFGFREDSRHSHAKLEEEDDGNNSFCSECGAGGTLACCDSCKGAIHVKCLKRASPTAAAAFDTALADGTLWMCQGCATYSSQEEQIVAYQAAADAALKEEDLRPFLLDAAEQVSVALGLELDEDGVEEMAGASLDSACARRSTK